jgi:hypothetical protein
MPTYEDENPITNSATQIGAMVVFFSANHAYARKLAGSTGNIILELFKRS